MDGKEIDGRLLRVDFARYGRPTETMGYDAQYSGRSDRGSRGQYGRDRGR